MQSAACSATAGHTKVGLTGKYALFLVSSCDGVLEASGVGGVTGNGNVNTLFPHDGYAFAHVVGTVAVDLSAVTVAVGGACNLLELTGEVVELGLHVSESVDTADNLGGVFAESVEDNSQRLAAHFVGSAGYFDSAFGCGKRLVSGEESEALSLVAEQTSSEVAVSDTHFAVVGHRARNAESLESQSDSLGCVGCYFAAFLDCDGGTYDVGPLSVLEADLLSFLTGLVWVDSILVADGVGLFDIFNSHCVECGEHLLDAAVLRFKFDFSYHSCVLLLFFTWVNILGCTFKTSVVALCAFESLFGGFALLKRVGEFAEAQEFVTYYFVVLVESHACAIAFGHFEVTNALGLSTEHSSHLAAESLTEVFERCTDNESSFAEGALSASVNDLQE